MILSSKLFSLDIPQRGVTDGHVKYVLSSHEPEDLALIGLCANVASSVLFERLGAQGTNIIMSMTEAGASVDIVARSENDGLGLEWIPKEVKPERMTGLQEALKDRLLEEKQEEHVPQEEPDDSDEEEVLIKQLLRIP